MLPAGLVWGRPDAAAAGLAAGGFPQVAGGMSHQPFVYCYAPQTAPTAAFGASGTAAAATVDLTSGFQLPSGATLLSPYQPLQSQQQQYLLAAATAKSLQQHHNSSPTAANVYHMPSAASAAAFGLQPSSAGLPYHIAAAAAASQTIGASQATSLPTSAATLHLHHQGALHAVQQQQQQQQQQQSAALNAYLQSAVAVSEHLYMAPSAAASVVSAPMSSTGTGHAPSVNAAIQQSCVITPSTTAAGRKRGSDEILPSVNGESSPGTVAETTGSDAKKARLDSNANTKASRVLQFRGLPTDVSESEILQLSLPFGSVTNIVIVKKKNQALVEMADLTSSHNTVSFYSQRSPIIRGHVVHVQFSLHDQLLPDDPTLQEGDSIGALDGVNENGTADEPRTVLRVVIENMLYPVTLDTLKQLFSQFGSVLKIVTFTKNGMLHALIQFAETSTAQAAKQGLNGQCMYNGCNLLRVDFSKLSELSVRFNNDKTRDFTNPLLPSGDVNGMVMPSSSTDQRALALATQGQLSAAMLAGYAPLLAYATAGSGGGMVPAGTILLAAPGGSTAVTSLCTVLLVSNLNEEKVTTDALFTLFGVYGDVIRVKIMFNKKDTALVQYNDPGQAQIAMNNLDKLKIWGKQIKVTPSKHNVVQMPKEGQPDAGLTKDYSNSPLHRFKKPNSKNYHNIFPPSATLHLSNIPGTSKERLIELFSALGSVVGFKFFQKDCKMALLQMSSIEEAAEALIAMHNFQLAETSHLRVSFSKSSVTPQTALPDNQ